MSEKAVITCALNGVLTDPRQHHVPVTPEEMAREARAAFNAGASIMHIHLRRQEPNKGHLPSWEVSVSREIQQAIREACPGVIINHTTGTSGPDYQGALKCVRETRPEIAACNAGSLNYLKVKADNTWAWPPMLFDNAVEKVQDYLDVVGRYIRRLHDVGVHVVATAAVPIAVEGRAPVVYLLQPRLDGAGLGNAILRSADDRTLCARLDAVLGDCRRVLLANRAPVDDRTATVDGQLSNWHFDRDLASPPLLIDVGTPFMRRHGAYEIDIGLFLAPAPPVVRQLFRRLRIVETYLDTFFDPRLLLVDLLGNFHKEGRPDRIDAAVAHVNTWLQSTGSDLGVEPIARAEVDRYYSKDAKLLEFYLKVRRLDRFVRTRIFRRVYPFVLPGPIRR